MKKVNKQEVEEILVNAIKEKKLVERITVDSVNADLVRFLVTKPKQNIYLYADDVLHEDWEDEEFVETENMDNEILKLLLDFFDGQIVENSVFLRVNDELYDITEIEEEYAKKLYEKLARRF